MVNIMPKWIDKINTKKEYSTTKLPLNLPLNCLGVTTPSSLPATIQISSTTGPGNGGFFPKAAF
jgi:hypothetical protein